MGSTAYRATQVGSRDWLSCQQNERFRDLLVTQSRSTTLAMNQNQQTDFPYLWDWRHDGKYYCLTIFPSKWLFLTLFGPASECQRSNWLCVLSLLPRTTPHPNTTILEESILTCSYPILCWCDNGGREKRSPHRGGRQAAGGNVASKRDFGEWETDIILNPQTRNFCKVFTNAHYCWFPLFTFIGPNKEMPWWTWCLGQARYETASRKTWGTQPKNWSARTRPNHRQHQSEAGEGNSLANL